MPFGQDTKKNPKLQPSPLRPEEETATPSIQPQPAQGGPQGNAYGAIASRQDLGGGVQRGGSKGSLTSFGNLYALNRDSGHAQAEELARKGTQAANTATRMARGEQVMGPDGRTPMTRQDAIGNAYKVGEETKAWSDPTARAGQIGLATGQSPMQSMYSSMYYGASNQPLANTAKRFGNLYGDVAGKLDKPFVPPAAKPGAAAKKEGLYNVPTYQVDPTGRGDRMMHLSELDRLEKMGFPISGPDRLRAQNDPAFLLELVRKYDPNHK